MVAGSKMRNHERTQAHAKFKCGQQTRDYNALKSNPSTSL